MVRMFPHAMNPKDQIPRVAFTREEVRAFRIHAVIVAAIAAGMFAVAPKGLGQVLGVLFAMALLPLPPLVIYLVRRRKVADEKKA
jgi:hypothetical protein